MRRLALLLSFLILLLLLSITYQPITAQFVCDPNAVIAPIYLPTLIEMGVRVTDFSHDNRYIIFRSSLGNLVPNDINGVEDVFLYDRWTCQSERVSIGTNGEQVISPIIAGGMTDDNRYVSFFTNSRLSPNDTNDRYDVYVRDRWLNTTTLLSISEGGVQANADVTGTISPDGHFAFLIARAATNWSNDGVGGFYSRDLWTGSMTRLIPRDMLTGHGEGSVVLASTDARYVAFTTSASAINPLLNRHIFLLDVWTGELRRITQAPDGSPANGTSNLDAMTPDGRFIVFTSTSTNLAPNAVYGRYIYDRFSGQTEHLSTGLGSGGSADQGTSENIQDILSFISDDGRIVAGATAGCDLMPGASCLEGAYTYDRWTGEVALVSTTLAGEFYRSKPLALSPDGSLLVVSEWAGSYFPDPGGDDLSSGYIVDWWRLPLAVPLPQSPQGDTRIAQPIFQWNTVPRASWYALWVEGEQGQVIYDWYDRLTVCAADVCSVTAPAALPPGTYRWWLQAWSAGTYSAWSAPVEFRILDASAPPAPIPLAPTGMVDASTLTYRWSVVAGATWYQVWVSSPRGMIANSWYSADNICAGTECSISLAPPYAPGLHRWWVQAWSPTGGYGAWSAETQFIVRLYTAQLIDPVWDELYEPNVWFSFSAVVNADYYYLWISSDEGYVHHQWYSSSAAYCQYSGFGEQCYLYVENLPYGKYRWWIQPWDADAGYGPWSAPAPFFIVNPESTAEVTSDWQPEPLPPAATQPAPEILPPEAPPAL